MTESETTYFGSFNARHIPPTKVPLTFVLSRHFSDAAESANSLIVGPRGSGKTTLLKMLTPEALRAWNHEKSQFYRDSIKFLGVFVPSDIQWRRQVESIGSAELPQNVFERLSISVYTTHVFYSLIQTIESVRTEPGTDTPSFMPLELGRELEVEICTSLASTWKLSQKKHSLLSLKHALADRLSDLYYVAQSLTDKIAEGGICTTDDLPEYVYLEPLMSFVMAVKKVNDYTGCPERIWALCVDELEIAPEWIQASLFKALRSTNQQIVLKLAVSPNTPELLSVIEADSSPALGNDLNVVSLTYPKQIEIAEFSRKLFDQIVQRLRPELASISVTRLLGDSEEQTDESGVLYIDSEAATDRIFASLCEKDESFREFLEKEELLDSEGRLHITNKDRGKKGPLVRKISPYVRYRDHYLRSWRYTGPDKRTGTSEKKPTKDLSFYIGDPVFLVVSEGNPRWLMGMTQEFLKYIDDNSTANQRRQAQSRALNLATSRFAALLESIPFEAKSNSLLKRGFANLVHQIAQKMKSQLLDNPFHPEPNLAFKIDKNLDDDLIGAIRLGLQLGVFIVKDDVTSLQDLASLEGVRIRLSYMVAAAYRLPTRSEEAVSLSRLLGLKSSSKNLDKALPVKENSTEPPHSGASIPTRQVPLFDDDEK